MVEAPALTVREAADELQLDGSEVYGLIFAHALGFTQAVNGRILVPRQALDDYQARGASEMPTTS